MDSLKRLLVWNLNSVILKLTQGQTLLVKAQQESEAARHQRRRLGLIQLYPEPHNTEISNNLRNLIRNDPETTESSVDIIAIHGLGANSSSYLWRDVKNENSRKVHWLQDLDMLPAVIPNSRIFSYEWNAGFDQGAITDNMAEHADTLLQCLCALTNTGEKGESNIERRPIILLAACFGGLLLIKALHRAATRALDAPYNLLLMQTVGAIFMGTPFLGSHVTMYKIFRLHVRIARRLGEETSEYLVDLLRKENKELNEMVRDFYELTLTGQPLFPIHCFYETKKADYEKAVEMARDNLDKAIRGRKGWMFGKDGRVLRKLSKEVQEMLYEDLTILVVDRQSSTLKWHNSSLLDVKHGGLIRFPGPEDPSFIKVADRLREFTYHAREVLQIKRGSLDNAVSSSGIQQKFDAL